MIEKGVDRRPGADQIKMSDFLMDEQKVTNSDFEGLVSLALRGINKQKVNSISGKDQSRDHFDNWKCLGRFWIWKSDS